MLFLYGRPIRCQVLRQVCNHVAGGLDAACTPGETGRGGGVHTGGVVHKIGGKGGVLNLLGGQVPGQLMDQRCHHFHVAQFFGTCRGVGVYHSHIFRSPSFKETRAFQFGKDG